MKKHLLKNILAPIVALFVAFVALPQSAQAQTTDAYVVEDGATLTFYYDANKATRTGTVYGINQKNSSFTYAPIWAGASYTLVNDRIERVVFDSSFKDYKPTDTSYWFSYCSKLATIEGISNLSTDQVTNMESMFKDCIRLTSLDLSSFNTSKVTDMGSMFYCCEKLTSLDVSNFNTENVTDMSYMFSMTNVLTSLNVKSFNTANVTDMRSMFSDCYALTSLDVSNFNTSKVTDMSYMFNGCDFTSIDLSNFNTEKVTDMEMMFYNCDALKTIYCDDDWNSSTVTNSKNMFFNCKNLKGAVAFDKNKVDASMANPITGYFTRKDGGEVYVVENGSTLTFYCDTKKATRTGTVYGINDKLTGSETIPAWAGEKNNINTRIKKVVFDNSFKK